jgi:hypothetical protein
VKATAATPEELSEVTEGCENAADTSREPREWRLVFWQRKEIWPRQNGLSAREVNEDTENV